MRTSTRCKYCNEEVFVEPKNVIQYMISDYVLKLKCHIHWKQKHGLKYLTKKGLTKSILMCTLGMPLAVIVLIVWLITYPAWWLHEKMN